MYVVMTKDNNGIWYFKSAYIHYNWTKDIKKAKKFKTEKDACAMIHRLWVNDRGCYQTKYI